jgi:ubiquinol-cytochrome c reductase iron-sulfur subunit
MATFFWRKQPIYVVRRTPEMVASLASHDGELKDPKSDASDQPAYTKNADRSLKPDVLVLIGTCTHLGCLPKSRFAPNDAAVMAKLAGRLLLSVPWLEIRPRGACVQRVAGIRESPRAPYSFSDDNTLVIGLDSKDKGVA